MLRLVLIGRPNVGKSTLFNALVGKRLALVHDAPGVTRDWREAKGNLFGADLMVIDTAGVDEGAPEGTITAAMRQGTMVALSQADVALFLVDGRAGLTAADRDLAVLLRKAKIPVILGVAKAEHNRTVASTLAEAHALGLGEPIALSAAHTLGLDTLYEALCPYLTDGEEEEDHQDTSYLPPDIDALEGMEDYVFPDVAEPDVLPIKLALIGRPNVGKSTLFNALIGTVRSLTGPEAGVTRDAVEVRWRWGERNWRLVDTAGLRKRARVVGDIEHMAGGESLRAVRLAQMVVLVIDATAGIERQDLTLAGHVLEEGRALLVAVNKWDAVVGDKPEVLGEIRNRLIKGLGQAGGVPIVTLSALTGRRVPALMEAALSLYSRWNARIGTGVLNRWLAAQVAHHPPPLASGRPNKMKYITQVKARPPTFVLWSAQPDAVPESWRRYLVAGLQRDFGMEGAPLRLDIRASKNPYAD